MTCKFKDYKYERPNLDAVREKITALTTAMQTAKTFEEAAAVIEDDNEHTCGDPLHPQHGRPVL